MGEESSSETPKKGKKNPLAGLKAISAGAAAASAPVRQLSDEEAKQLAAEVFGVPPPSTAIARSVAGEVASEGEDAGEAEDEAEGEDETPDDLLVAAEELGPLAKEIQRGNVSVPRGLVKGFSLIAKAFQQLANEDEDESAAEPLSSEEVAPFVRATTALQLIYELLLGNTERREAFKRGLQGLPLADQALFNEVLRHMPVLLKELPEAFAEVTDASEEDLALLGVSFLRELQERAQAAIDDATKKG